MGKEEHWCPHCCALKWMLPTGDPEKHYYTCVGCLLLFELQDGELFGLPETPSAVALGSPRRRKRITAWQRVFDYGDPSTKV